MSNVLSIAAVTGLIKYLLENGLVRDAIAASVGDVIVTALPPDRISVGSDERAQINLFLYQVTQNRNVDWVSQGLRKQHTKITGNLDSTNPPLALDLHYLLTAYGAKDFQAEILLGYAMQMLHQSSVIASETIENALKNASKNSPSSVFSQALAGVSVSELAAQIGQIRISPEFFKMEETSTIWSALQTHYRPSATYQVSMVFVESNTNQTEGFHITPLSRPNIEQVIVASEQPEQVIFVGSKLLLRGKQLRGDVTKIRLSGKEKILPPSDVKETQITLVVPPDLRPGVQEVQVIHQMQTMHNIVESNVMAFVVHPMITVSVAQVQAGDSGLCSAKINVKFNLEVGQEQRVILLLNHISKEKTIPYSFSVPSRKQNTDIITIPVENILPGTYFVRVQVDGAESPLYKEKTGEYNSPQVTIF